MSRKCTSSPSLFEGGKLECLGGKLPPPPVDRTLMCTSALLCTLTSKIRENFYNQTINFTFGMLVSYHKDFKSLPSQFHPKDNSVYTTAGLKQSLILPHLPSELGVKMVFTIRVAALN